MQTDLPLDLLGGLSADAFMRRYWQKKPLLIRQALPGFAPPVARARLFALAADEGVESRLVARDGTAWSVRKGPFKRRALPPLGRRDWTLLVQGVDVHDDAVHALMNRFRFVPDARLDDVMVSFATDGGGVGPHFDSYDVFLLQAHGKRRWRIGRQRNAQLRDDVPLKILAHFEPEQEYLLAPGDMLYLPPGWAHDGIAEGECLTYSVGFRVPEQAELGRELLARLADEGDATGRVLYRDAGQAAVQAPAEVPQALAAFARQAVEHVLAEPLALERALGELLTEPKANVWFDPAPMQGGEDGLVLDRRTRMLFDSRHVFINGESFLASGKDARLMRKLANQRFLGPSDMRTAGPGAMALLSAWGDAGWLHATEV
jgi:50S ribosomal protein L16 3-hydroxylase